MFMICVGFPLSKSRIVQYICSYSSPDVEFVNRFQKLSIDIQIICFAWFD